MQCVLSQLKLCCRNLGGRSASSWPCNRQCFWPTF